VLKNRLERKAEEKRMIPEIQTGSRRGGLIIDNIFVLLHIIQSITKGRKQGRRNREGSIYDVCRK